MEPVTVVAVDLGASSGRVMVARVGADRLDLQEVHRFANEPVWLWESGRAGLHWDCVRLYSEIIRGLRQARESLAAGEQIASVGIDGWAVDYGLLGADGTLLGVPYCYRDERSAAGVEAVHALVPPAGLFRRNGLQFLPFNTVYQLAAEPPARLAPASVMLLLPDLFAYWLTGVARAEVTNASTTGLLDVATRTWDVDLAGALRLPSGLLPPLVRPGEIVGTLLPHVSDATGLPRSTPVIAVGSHDTASAVVAMPATDDRVAYISSGTWSLVGVELSEPVLTPAARQANFTNEGGVDGRVRFLRNVMGLWLLSECLNTWEIAGSAADFDLMLSAAARVPAGGPVFDPDDPVFLAPGDMPARIEQACRAAGGAVPADRPALVRCILDSLAAAYARAVDDAVRLTGRDVDAIHVLGGGSRNELLCALTANATGRPVLAGPVEATALGNALIQARARGALDGDLEAVRAALRDGLSATTPVTQYHPTTPRPRVGPAPLPERTR
jgi:rhamnulokinase